MNEGSKKSYKSESNMMKQIVLTTWEWKAKVQTRTQNI